MCYFIFDVFSGRQNSNNNSNKNTVYYVSKLTERYSTIYLSHTRYRMSSIYDVYKTKEIHVTMKPDNKEIVIKPKQRPIDIIDQFQSEQQIVGVYCNNELQSLNETIEIDSVLEPVVAGSEDSIDMLKETLGFILQCASCSCNPGLCLQQKFDMFGAIYFRYDDMIITDRDIKNIQDEMDSIIQMSLPIHKVIMSYQQIIQELNNINHQQARSLVMTLNNPVEYVAEIMLLGKEKMTSRPMSATSSDSQTQVLQLKRCESLRKNPFHLLWKHALLANTGICKGMFQLQKYEGGILLHYSKNFKTVSTSPILKDEAFQSQVFRIMMNYLDQAQACHMDSVASVNKLVARPKDLSQAMAYAEFNIERQLSEVISRVNNKIKIIFLAGPSSSAKTTTANRIACHLCASGYEPLRVSLDDYYNTPDKAAHIEGTNENDWESLYSLRLDKIKENLSDIIAGKETTLPSYDFKTQTYSDAKKVRLSTTGILILEGIHGLNDEITKTVPPENRLRVFIQPIGSLIWDETRSIDFSMSRLMRRMCRDYIFRGASAEKTIKMWKSVREGEQKWIFPNASKADIYLNTSVCYEQFALRVYALPLLTQVERTSPCYTIARHMIKMLAPLMPVPVHFVPEMSSICEFLPGGSQYEEFYF